MLEDLGQKLDPESVAEIFEVEASTVLRYPSKYGGVRFGKSALFFENLIAQTIRRQHALQVHPEGKDGLEGAKDRRRQKDSKTVSDQGGSPAMGTGRVYPVGAAADPFNLTSCVGK